MTEQTAQIESRLKRAERGVMILGAALVLSVAGFSYLLYGPPGTLRAASLEVVDAGGNTIALLGEREGRTGLFLVDENSMPRVAVFHAEDADGVYINDDQGVTRIGVAQFAHGGGGLALHGPASKGAAVLYYKNEGSLKFYEADGAIRQAYPPARPD